MTQMCVTYITSILSVFCLLGGTNVIIDRVTRPDPLKTYAIPSQMITER